MIGVRSGEEDVDERSCTRRRDGLACHTSDFRGVPTLASRKYSRLLHLEILISASCFDPSTLNQNSIQNGSQEVQVRQVLRVYQREAPARRQVRKVHPGLQAGSQVAPQRKV